MRAPLLIEIKNTPKVLIFYLWSMHMPLPLKSDRQSPVFFPLLPVKLILIDAQLHMRIRFQQQVTASQVLLLLLPTAKPCFARTRAH